jgi:hypothetical protein
MMTIARQAADFVTKETLFTLPTGVGQVTVCKADSSRVYLAFQATGANGCHVSTGQASDVNSVGIRLSPTVNPWELRFSESGPMCQLEWHGNATSPGTNLTVIEVFYRPGADDFVAVPQPDQ